MALLLTASACATPPPDDVVLAGTLRGRTVASLLVLDAASQVTVRAVELPGQLYRVATPGNGGLEPVVTVTRGQVRVGLRASGRAGPDTVLILLNRRVSWDVRLPAGAGEQLLDLAGGRVRRLELGAAGLVELRLPRPRGRVPVLFRESVGKLLARLPACRAAARDCYVVRNGQ